MITNKTKTAKKESKIKVAPDILYECAVDAFNDFGLDVEDIVLLDNQIYVKSTPNNASSIFSDLLTTSVPIQISDHEDLYWVLSDLLSSKGPFASTFQRKFLFKHKLQETETINDKAQHIIGKIISARIIKKAIGKILCETYTDGTPMEGVIFQEFQSPSDNYVEGKTILCLVRNIIKTGRKYSLFLDRVTNDFVKALFYHSFLNKLQDVEIKSVVRIPGLRTKIALSSSNGNALDIGKIIGFGGVSLQPVVTELKEKVDVIQWFDDNLKMIASAMMPIKVQKIEFINDKHIIVYVSPESVVSVIGKDGLNIKMISILLNIKVTVKPIENQL